MDMTKETALVARHVKHTTPLGNASDNWLNATPCKRGFAQYWTHKHM